MVVFFENSKQKIHTSALLAFMIVALAMGSATQSFKKQIQIMEYNFRVPPLQRW